MAGVVLYHRRVSVRQYPVQLSAAKALKELILQRKVRMETRERRCFYLCGYTDGILVLCMELLKGYLPVHLALREVNPALMELCADSGSPGFRTCLPVFTATERWKSHCGIVRGTAGAGTVLASGTVSGSPVSDLFPGDRDRAAFLPFGLYLCTVFRQCFLSGGDDRYQCRLLSDLGCGDPESLRQISGRADECATGTSSVRKRQGISTVMIVC